MNISFSATKEQFRARRKHVTRRLDKSLHLYHLKPGTILTAIEKAQGLKKGEHVVRMGEIVVLEVGREPLDHIIKSNQRGIPENIRKIYATWTFPLETDLEGFPELAPSEFVAMFCKMNKCTPDTEVTRILFDYMDGTAGEHKTGKRE